MLGVSRRRVLQLLADGVLEGDKETNGWRITALSVNAELTRRQARARARAARETRRIRGADDPPDFRPVA